MIDNKETYKVMQNELKCVKIASKDLCDRNCAKCKLLMDTDKIIDAYVYVLNILKEKGAENV